MIGDIKTELNFRPLLIDKDDDNIAVGQTSS